MSKRVLKLRPNDYWRIGEHESWFADMAKQGLHLKKTGLWFVHFEKGEPKNTRYRIDVTRGGISYERNNLYREFGWNYITSYGKFCVFSSPEESGAAELHTEPEEQSYTLSTLDKELKGTAIFVSIAIALIFFMMFSIFFLDSTPILNLINGQYLQQLLFILLETYVLWTTMQAWLSIRALRKSLLEGIPIDHSADWRKGSRRNMAVGLTLIIFSFLGILLPLMSIIKTETATLPESKTDLPIVRLAEIEENPNLERDTSYGDNGIDWSNQLFINWSPLTIAQYEADEQGLVKNQQWEDGSGQYSPSIHTQYFELRFAGMSDNLLKDLMKRYIDEEEEKLRLQKIEKNSFDRIYVMKDSVEKQIFASHGNKVFYIRYYGYASLDKILTLAGQI